MQHVYNPFTWNVIFRPVVSSLAGILVSFGIWLIVAILSWFTGTANLIPLSAWIGIAAALSLYFGMLERKDPDVVPGTKFVAMVTWLEMPLGIYRSTGRYEWQGSSLGLGRTTRTTREFTDANGYIKAGQIPFRVWNRGTSRAPNGEESSLKPIVIEAPAKNRALVRATITLILQIINPRRMLDSDDPELDIGDRTRQEWREFTSRFVDTDVPLLQEAVSHVLRGVKIITCFLSTPIGSHKDGSMVRDSGDIAMFCLVEDPSREDEYIARFTQRIIREIHPNMREHVITQQTDGSEVVNLSYVQVQNPIKEVTGELGFKLVRVTVGDIMFSERVQEAANEASSEADQRAAQEASARAIKAARTILLPTNTELQNPGWQTATILAAAQDDKRGNIKVVLSVTGGNPFAEAAAVGATQFGGNNNGNS